jgi:hypothetical protein
MGNRMSMDINMKKIHKILIVILTTIALIIGGYNCYIYVVQPKIFDYFIEKNVDVIKGLEKDIEKQAEKDIQKGIEKEIEKDITKERAGNDTKKPEGQTDPNVKPEPTPTTEYQAKTSIGSISNADLLKVMQNISPSDKAKIIGILRAGVPSSEIPKFATMAKDGLDSSEKRYIESYMRANLPNSSKREILNIILKYAN